jgi:hypothetical protein
MKTLAILASVLGLVACGASGQGTDPAVAGPCGNIQPLLDARGEAIPFESLRGENKMLGDSPLPDSFLGRFSAFGGTCEAHVMSGFFGETSTIYTYSCDLFEGGMMDRDADQVKAETAFKAAQDELAACLGSGWISEEKTDNPDFDVYHKITYKPEDMARSEGGFTADPAYLEMSFTPFMRGRGGPSGWLVVLQFQQQVDGES